MASVKWLTEVRVLDRPFRGFFQGDRYIMLGEGFRGEPVTRLLVKSFIGWPFEGVRLPLGPVHVVGMAWSGHGGVTRVEFSDDGGRSWRDARLTGPDHRHAWRQWTLRWDPPGPGSYVLASRAHDGAGNVQPDNHRWNSLGYAFNGVRRVRVTVVEG